MSFPETQPLLPVGPQRVETYQDGVLEVVEDGRTVEDARAHAAWTVRERARRALARTDWYIVREAELGAAKRTPASILTARSQVRSASDTAILAIETASTPLDVDVAARATDLAAAESMLRAAEEAEKP